jgi:NADH:ubiquinone oxidoreductase subunit 5 (subunit L)/multisubunit Na+/H+ antiporter MnhA subunit
VIYAMHAAYHHTGSHEDAQDMRNMGGLKQYMPVTFALMWIATLAIAGIPPLAGFFSKDEILGCVFTRAHEHSTIAQAHLFGIPGASGCTLRGLWAGRRVHDGDVHDAHDDLHLPRPESHGEKANASARERRGS